MEFVTALALTVGMLYAVAYAEVMVTLQSYVWLKLQVYLNFIWLFLGLQSQHTQSW